MKHRKTWQSVWFQSSAVVGLKNSSPRPPLRLISCTYVFSLCIWYIMSWVWQWLLDVIGVVLVGQCGIAGLRKGCFFGTGWTELSILQYPSQARVCFFTLLLYFLLFAQMFRHLGFCFLLVLSLNFCFWISLKENRKFCLWFLLDGFVQISFLWWRLCGCIPDENEKQQRASYE